MIAPLEFSGQAVPALLFLARRPRAVGPESRPRQCGEADADDHKVDAIRTRVRHVGEIGCGTASLECLGGASAKDRRSLGARFESGDHGSACPCVSTTVSVSAPSSTGNALKWICTGRDPGGVLSRYGSSVFFAQAAHD